MFRALALPQSDDDDVLSLSNCLTMIVFQFISKVFFEYLLNNMIQLFHNLYEGRFLFLPNLLNLFCRVGKKRLFSGFHFVLNETQTSQVKTNGVL